MRFLGLCYAAMAAGVMYYTLSDRPLTIVFALAVAGILLLTGYNISTGRLG